MRLPQIRRSLLMMSAGALLALVPGAAFSKEASHALELARQLNQAFIEVADQVSPAVVVGADKIKIRFKDDVDWYDAEVRGVDSQSDLAVLKIDPKGRKLTVATLADSDKTRVGEFAIAIGAPFELDYSVTFGHVSAKGRSHILESYSMDQDFIQTDANINPGNSVGPLINIDGEVIGINTLIRGMHTGIGFAIPANLAREVADKLV